MKILIGIGYAVEYIVVLVVVFAILHFMFARIRSAFRSVFGRSK